MSVQEFSTGNRSVVTEISNLDWSTPHAIVGCGVGTLVGNVVGAGVGDSAISFTSVVCDLKR